VSYPKLKSQRSKPNEKEPGGAGRPAEEEEKFQLSRPLTYTVEPSLADLTLAISSSRELDSPAARTELMAVIQDFLGSKREESK
jgi:hypothetical protein